MCEPQRNADSRRPRAAHRHAARVLLLLASAHIAWLTGCGGDEVRTDHPFWLRAAADPTLRLLPAVDDSTPGVIQERVVSGEVVGLRQAQGAEVGHVLEVRPTDGEPMQLHYRIGGDEPLPVTLGMAVRLHVFRRLHLEDEGADVGLLLYRRVDLATLPRVALEQPHVGPTRVQRAAPEPSVQDRLLAVVQCQGVVAQGRLPPVLRTVEPSDLAAYHESANFSPECDETRVHNHFVLSRPEWMTDLKGQSLSARVIAPGSRLVLDDGQTRFAVQLIDNRKTIRSGCRVQPEPAWAFAATRLAHPEEGPEVSPAATPPVTPRRGKSVATPAPTDQTRTGETARSP